MARLSYSDVGEERQCSGEGAHNVGHASERLLRDEVGMLVLIAEHVDLNVLEGHVQLVQDKRHHWRRRRHVRAVELEHHLLQSARTS